MPQSFRNHSPPSPPHIYHLCRCLLLCVDLCSYLTRFSLILNKCIQYFLLCRPLLENYESFLFACSFEGLFYHYFFTFILKLMFGGIIIFWTSNFRNFSTSEASCNHHHNQYTDALLLYRLSHQGSPHFHITEYYSALEKKELLIQSTMWMKLSNIMLSDRSQPQVAFKWLDT